MNKKIITTVTILLAGTALTASASRPGVIHVADRHHHHGCPPPGHCVVHHHHDRHEDNSGWCALVGGLVGGLVGAAVSK